MVRKKKTKTKLRHAKPTGLYSRSDEKATGSERGERKDAGPSRIYTHLLPLPRQSSPIGSTEEKQEEQEKFEKSELRGLVEE